MTVVTKFYTTVEIVSEISDNLDQYGKNRVKIAFEKTVYYFPHLLL